jgi:hypothetical protein
MKHKLVVDGVLSLMTLVILLMDRKSLAQRLPDAMENLHLLSYAGKDQTTGRRLMTASQDFSDFGKFINTIDAPWPKKIMQGGGSDNSSACAEDLAEWRRGIFRKDIWALSREYAD